MKWVGSATAILTLLFALQRVVMSITDAREKRRQSSELLTIAKTQQRDGIFEEALATLQKAEPLRVNDADVRSLQEDVAMQWARQARKTAQQDWNDVVHSAVEMDSTNAYAHAMWGHWILWQHGSIDQGRRHFATAVASGSHRDFVRFMQIAALRNAHDSAARAEVIRVASEMRARRIRSPPRFVGRWPS